MMNVSRLGDLSTVDPSPCSAPARPIIQGSSNVFANGIPIARLGDSYQDHTCIGSSTPHSATASSGSSTVFCNGLPIHRVSDNISCGSTSAQGSPDVFCG